MSFFDKLILKVYLLHPFLSDVLSDVIGVTRPSADSLWCSSGLLHHSNAHITLHIAKAILPTYRRRPIYTCVFAKAENWGLFMIHPVGYVPDGARA